MREPEIGELRHLATVRAWQDTAAAGSGITQTYSDVALAWVKITPVAGSQYYGSQQVANAVTHRMEMRYLTTVTSEHVIDCEGQRYRVKRVSHMNGERRYTVCEVEELGPAT